MEHAWATVFAAFYPNMVTPRQEAAREALSGPIVTLHLANPDALLVEQLRDVTGRMLTRAVGGLAGGGLAGVGVGGAGAMTSPGWSTGSKGALPEEEEGGGVVGGPGVFSPQQVCL